MKITASKAIPPGSAVTQEFGLVDYADSYAAQVPAGRDVDAWATLIFRAPGWVGGLMRVRNALGRIVGLRGQGEWTPAERIYYPVGSRAPFFTVVARTDHEIVMQEDDRHLDFRVSVTLNPGAGRLYITTLVHFRNRFGRLYFFLIKPFHRLILRTLLGRAVRSE